MINLCVDRGNTYTKLAVFDADKLLYDALILQAEETKHTRQIFQKYAIQNTIISSVIADNPELYLFLEKNTEKCIHLDHQTALPITNAYQTPETLGKDRLAAVVGAFALQPKQDILIIDIGTAITYDFIDANAVYHGGNIAPGVKLRLKSMHEMTQNLPLVEFDTPDSFLGKNTVSALQSGVFYGVLLEIEGYIEKLMLNYPKLLVFLTGGYAVYFENKLKNRIFADKNLVLIGLNRILQYNV